jgi:hypothetical protein
MKEIKAQPIMGEIVAYFGGEVTDIKDITVNGQPIETVGYVAFAPRDGVLPAMSAKGECTLDLTEHGKALADEWIKYAEEILGVVGDELREAIEEMARLCAQPAESMSHGDRSEAISMLEWFQGYMVAAIDIAEQDAKKTETSLETTCALLKLWAGEDITAQEAMLILESFEETAERAEENLEWLSAALGGLTPKKTRRTRRKRERRMPTRNGRAMMNRVPIRREQHR